MAADRREFTDCDWDDIPRDVLPFPNTSGNNMPDIGTSPPQRGRGLWISPTRRRRGIGPSSAGPTPATEADSPAGRGRGLRSSPPRRGRGLWNPPIQRGRGLRPPSPDHPMSPLPVLGASAQPEEWVGSGCVRMKRGCQPWQPKGLAPHVPHLPPKCLLRLPSP